MKIDAHILEISDHGESIKLVLQGQARSGGEHAPWHRYELGIPMNEKNRRAFYMGRHVEITIKPRP